MVRLSNLSVYSLISGSALLISNYVWHVWSDNAYLYTYLIGMALLLLGMGSVAVALAKSLGWARALLGLILAAVISFILIIPMGLAKPVTDRILQSGNGSHSPCLTETRKNLSEPISSEPLGMHQPSSEELRSEEQSSLNGALAQLMIPLLTGVILVGVLLSRSGTGMVRRGIITAVITTAYIFARGPAAWCGQIFGLDEMVVTITGLLLATSVIKFPKR